MSKLRNCLTVLGLPVVCLSLLMGGSNAYAASNTTGAEVTKAAVTKGVSSTASNVTKAAVTRGVPSTASNMTKAVTSSASNKNRTAVTKLAATSVSTDYKDVAGIWKYKDSEVYICLEENQSWAVYNIYGMTVDGGTYEISGDVITLHFDSDGGTDTYTISENGELLDVGGNAVIRVDQMEFLPRPEDRLTQVTKFRIHLTMLISTIRKV